MLSTPLSSGADLRVRRCCDRIAALIVATRSGRLVAGLVDDVLRALRTARQPDEAVGHVLLTWAEADEATIRHVGAGRWPPAVQAVPSARTPASPAPPAAPSPRSPGGTAQRRSYGVGRAA